MSRKTRRSARRTQLFLEALEARRVLDVAFGWGAGPGDGRLWFEILGDDTPNTVNISTNGSGDTYFEISYEADGETQWTGGTVSAGDIASEEAASGKSFGGYYIRPYDLDAVGGDNDTVNAASLKFFSIHALTGSGNDTVTGSQRNDTIDTGAGNDKVSGGPTGPGTSNGSDTITSGTGDDNIDGGAGNDVINAGEGNDIVTGGTGNDNITGGPAVLGGFDNDVLDGGDGNDTVSGGSGFDSITGGNGVDKLFGGTESDIINAEYQDSVIDGGTGGETTVVQNPPSIPAAPFRAPSAAFGIGDVLNLSGNATAPNNPYLNNTFEVINSSTGTDNIDSSGFAGGGDFAGKGVTVTSSGADAGNDNFVGSNFADNMDGGAGNDNLEGLAGNDTLTGGAGTDTVSYSKATTDVTVNLSSLPQSASGGADVGTDTISGFENATGGAGNDTLMGSNVVGNVLNGGGGNDYLTGLSGNDTINGGDGDDEIEGGLGNDTLNGDKGNDVLDGGSGNDVLDGGLGNDFVDGGSGNDVIRINYTELGTGGPAGSGLNPNDTFFGGSGGDTFTFYNVPFDDGDDDIAGNADDNPDENAVYTILQYLDDMLDAGMSDYDETLDGVFFTR